MNKLNRFYLFLLFATAVMSVNAQKKNTDSAPIAKQTHEEWLQSLPEKVRDSIVYVEWKQAVGEQEKEANEAAKVKIDEAIANPNLTSLDLSYYPNTELDPRLLSLKKLQRLNLYKAKKLDLVKLFDFLTKFPELHALSLADGNYAELPSNIGNLINLDSLNFRNSNIIYKFYINAFGIIIYKICGSFLQKADFHIFTINIINNRYN